MRHIPIYEDFIAGQIDNVSEEKDKNRYLFYDLEELLDHMSSNELKLKLINSSENSISIFCENNYEYKTSGIYQFTDYLEDNYRIIRAIEKSRELVGKVCPMLELHTKFPDKWRSEIANHNRINKYRAYTETKSDYLNEDEYLFYKFFESIDFDYKRLVLMFPQDNDPYSNRAMKGEDRISWGSGGSSLAGVLHYKGKVCSLDKMSLWKEVVENKGCIMSLNEISCMIFSIKDNKYNIQMSKQL